MHKTWYAANNTKKVTRWDHEDHQHRSLDVAEDEGKRKEQANELSEDLVIQSPAT